MIGKFFKFIWNMGMAIPLLIVAFIFFGFFIGGPKGIFIAAINVAGLVYLLMPTDIIPDFIPLAGFLDDLVVVFILFFIDIWAFGMVLAWVVQLLPIAIVLIILVAVAKYLRRKK